MTRTVVIRQLRRKAYFCLMKMIVSQNQALLSHYQQIHLKILRKLKTTNWWKSHQTRFPEEGKKPEKDMILSCRRGKSKKWSRSEIILSNAFAAMKEQQKETDERFFKMEEDRRRQDLEV
eukprot:gene1068-405_t